MSIGKYRRLEGAYVDIFMVMQSTLRRLDDLEHASTTILENIGKSLPVSMA